MSVLHSGPWFWVLTPAPGVQVTFRMIFLKMLNGVKEQCHEIWVVFLNQKIPLGPHMNRQKRLREIFRFRKDIHKKCVSA